MDSLDPSKHNNFTPFITLTAEEYEAVKYKIPAGLIVILTDGSSPMAINGALIPSSGGVITLDETFITTTDETANLPNSTNLGAIGTTGNNVLISTIATGESTLSAVAIPTTGLLTATSGNGLQFTNNYVTGNQPLTFNSGTSPHNITANTLALTGAQTISSTLSVGGTSTLAGVSATTVSTSGAISSGGLLTAASGFTQSSGAHNVTTGNTASTISTGTAALNITASTLALTGNETVSGTLSSAGLTTTNGFTQSGGNWSQTAGNHTYSNNTGAVLFTAQTVDLIGTAVGIQGQFTVNGSSILAGTSVTTLSASGAVTSGGLLTGSSGFNLQSTGTISTINCGSNALNVTTSNLNVTGSGTFSGTLSAGSVTFTTLNATNITASGTLGVSGTSTLAGVNATSVSTTGSITSGTTLTASNGFVQSAGSHNVTTGNTASTISTGTAALNITASTLALTGNETISGTLGVTGTATMGTVNATSVSTSGAISAGSTLTASNGFVQSAGSFSVVTGNNTASINTGSADLNISVNTLTLTGKQTISGTLGVSSTATFAGIVGTSLSVSNGLAQTGGALSLVTGGAGGVINTGAAALALTAGSVNMSAAASIVGTLTVGGIQNSAYNQGAGSFLYFVNNGSFTVNALGTGSIVLNSPIVSMPSLTSSTGTNIVASGTNLYLQTSSRDFKDNIVDTTIDTSKVFDLRTVDYQYKATGQKSFGFIAEEVAEVLPDLVHYEEDKPFSINYSLLSVLLLEELKKVKTELKSLTQKINSM